tara:strand:+ start:7843 stop:8208 length:366 start_codon:yes stop_codon:yes gene_type:complete
VNQLFVVPDLRPEFTFPVRLHTSKSSRIRLVFLEVSSVLNLSTGSKICTNVVQTIAVSMVDNRNFIAPENLPVHLDSFLGSIIKMRCASCVDIRLVDENVPAISFDLPQVVGVNYSAKSLS